MSPKKLTNDDKQEILNLYRQTPETTSTLADRYGVSSSTISRFLKNTLSDMEYEDLIQQKRLARTNKPQGYLDKKLKAASKQTKPVIKETPVISEPVPEATEAVESSVESLPEKPSSKPLPVRVKKDVPILVSTEEDEESETEDLEEVDVAAVVEMLGEELEDSDDDWDEEEDDDEDEDEDEDDYDESLSAPKDIQVLPLSAATFPKTCYLVIDRAAELIVKPLKEFAHLGQIPSAEVQQRTLPIFDNHR
ncbi:MAG: transposase, partial [Crocosphaera sp.]